jgi:hypothetical protein
MYMGLVMLRQTKIHTADPLVHELSTFEAIEKRKGHKSPGIDHIPASLIKAGIRIIHSEISKFKSSLCKKELLPEQWKVLIFVYMYKKGHKTDCSNYRSILHLPTVYKIVSYILQIQRKLLRIVIMDFDATGQLLIICSAFIKCLKQKWEYNEAVHKLLIDCKEAYDSVRRENLCNILV